MESKYKYSTLHACEYILAPFSPSFHWNYHIRSLVYVSSCEHLNYFNLPKPGIHEDTATTNDVSKKKIYIYIYITWDIIVDDMGVGLQFF